MLFICQCLLQVVLELFCLAEEGVEHGAAVLVGPHQIVGGDYAAELIDPVHAPFEDTELTWLVLDAVNELGRAPRAHL